METDEYMTSGRNKSQDSIDSMYIPDQILEECLSPQIIVSNDTEPAFIAPAPAMEADSTLWAVQALDIKQEDIQMERHGEPSATRPTMNTPKEKSADLANKSNKQGCENIQENVTVVNIRPAEENPRPYLNPFKPSYQGTFISIKDCFPPSSKERALNLITTLYKNYNNQGSILMFCEEFIEEHWIYKKYETLLKRHRAKDFLLENFNRNNFDIVQKSEDQKQELQNISGLERLLYTILLKCEWIPFQFKCFLAVIMSPQQTQENHHYTTTLLSL